MDLLNGFSYFKNYFQVVYLPFSVGCSKTRAMVVQYRICPEGALSHQSAGRPL